MSVLPGFCKAQSDNLPKIDSMAMFSFLGKNPDFMGAEIRGIKTKRSGRESYGDNAVGYVQVKRESNLCTVNAKVTPEHSIRKKAYDVTLLCNEVEEEIISVTCNDCAASLGGCKHAVAFLTWLHRRSEEPAVTSVSCYWKTSRLSSVGKSIKFIKAKSFCKKEAEPLSSSNGIFLNSVLETSKLELRYEGILPKYLKRITDVEALSLHHLLVVFLETQQEGTADDFLKFCSSQMSRETSEKAANDTILQSESSLWFELRYARITASIAYEAAHCHTLEGSLVETILGARSLKDSAAMMRGKKLEKKVRRTVGKLKGINIDLCGLKTSGEYPILGASPDGISKDYVIEIKCPSNEKTVVNYIKNGQITDKYMAQIQMQMYFCKKLQGLFCVANVDFETSNAVTVLNIEFDENYCMDVLEKCTSFWKKALYPILRDSLSFKK